MAYFQINFCQSGHKVMLIKKKSVKTKYGDHLKKVFPYDHTMYLELCEKHKLFLFTE